MLDVMAYIEVNTKFDRGKGTKSRSVVTVHAVIIPGRYLF